MSYNPADLIKFNLQQLRRHMLNQGCTAQQWESGLFDAYVTERRASPIAQLGRMTFDHRQHASRDPENLDPMGPQNKALE